MQHLGHSIVADRLYGGGASLCVSDLAGSPTVPTPDSADETPLIDRQALHAYRLAFCHPQSGKPVEFEAPLPDDIQRTLAALEHYRPAK
jgi:23S rRNA pseudouridine1911/1915/1917 synthase